MGLLARGLSGKVVDTDGQPLGGVTINERGTANGTSSKLDGTYSFYYRGKNPILVFSYIGYATQEIQLIGCTELNVTMEPDASLLDQVVIVGTRRQNRVQTLNARSGRYHQCRRGNFYNCPR